MKKIQVASVAIKANAQVIVLDASFITRVVKSRFELDDSCDFLTNQAKEADDHARVVVEHDSFHFTGCDIRKCDTVRINTALQLLQDIEDAFMADDKDDNKEEAK